MNPPIEQHRRQVSVVGWLQLSFAAGCFVTAAWARWRAHALGADERLEIGLLVIGGSLSFCLSMVAFIVERGHRRNPLAADYAAATAPRPESAQQIAV